MKRILCVLAVIIFGSHVNATIHTVNNNNPSPGQFTSLSDAVIFASTGDTIYLHGSPIPYGPAYPANFSIWKPLTLIGPGFDPNKDNGFPAFLHSRVDVSSFVGWARLIGLEINGLVWDVGASLHLERCKVNLFLASGLNADSALIKNNLIGEIEYINGPVSTLKSEFRNNIVFDQDNDYVSFTNFINCIVDHNIFIGSAAGSIDGCINSHVWNNIFIGTSVYSLADLNTVFENNIIHLAAVDSFKTTNGCSSLNNLVGDPLFTNASLSPGYSIFNDYSFQPLSPCIGSGTGGTDMGIYDGLYPYPIGGSPNSGFLNSAEPQLPQVHKMQVVTPSVPKGSPVIISVTGESQE